MPCGLATLLWACGPGTILAPAQVLAPRVDAGVDAAQGDGSVPDRDGAQGPVPGDDASLQRDGATGAVDTGIDQYPDAFDPNDSPPKTGEPGCGFATAAFCDTFGAPSVLGGRSRELDSVFWSAARMQGQLSSTRAMGIGMALIPACRPALADRVLPDQDTLICDPVTGLESRHLLVAAAGQSYGQNGYRIRQPFDFEGREGIIVFDATVSPLSPLHGWVSLAITDEPMAMPGYSIYSNDEGTIIPRNALEVHFVNAPQNDRITVRNVHVFREWVDTLYTPDPGLGGAPFKEGRLNRFEVKVSSSTIKVTITPFAEDGVTFAGPAYSYSVQVALPFTRGWVHLSVHNHSTIKYSQPDSSFPAVVDAAVARIDNVGFDGPVLAGWREYEVPDALVPFTEPGFQNPRDPYNTEQRGLDLCYVVNDAARGPGQTLRFEKVAIEGKRARLAFSTWMQFDDPSKAASYVFRARLNGGPWHDYRLSPAEVAFFTQGPTTIDPNGAPVGDPGTQGRLAMLIDVPMEELVAGDNTLEFVTSNVPTGYPPLVCNPDLVIEL